MPSCYYPDGTIAPYDTPCNSSAPQSACCGSAANCMANGLCFDDGLLSRGSCTDKDWQSDACTQYCRDANPDGGSSVRLCKAYPKNEYTFTCQDQTLENCYSGINTFSVTSNTIVLRPTEIAALASACSASATRTADCTNARDAATQSSTCSATAGGFTSGDMAGLGAGIGVPLAIAFVTMLALLLVEKRKSRMRRLEGRDDGCPQQQGLWRQHPAATTGEAGVQELNPDQTRLELPGSSAQN